MKNHPLPIAASTPADRFRPIIEAAIASGADMSQQVLQLTHGDNARLRKDPAVGDEEIRFHDGAMSFLGVRVVVGSPVSALSELDGVIIPPSPSEVAIAAMAKGQKKGNKEVRKPKAETPKPAPATRTFTSPPSKSR